MGAVTVVFRRVTEVHKAQLNVKYGLWKGRIHATMLVDEMLEVMGHV